MAAGTSEVKVTFDQRSYRILERVAKALEERNRLMKSELKEEADGDGVSSNV